MKLTDSSPTVTWVSSGMGTTDMLRSDSFSILISPPVYLASDSSFMIFPSNPHDGDLDASVGLTAHLSTNLW